MRDLLGLPQPTIHPSATENDSSQKYAGVPLVQLDDDLESFTLLLDPVYLDQVMPPWLEPRQLLRLLRISGKYDFGAIGDWTRARLKEKLPADESTLGLLQSYASLSVAGTVIALGEECRLHEYGPFAYYALATSDWAGDPVEAPLVLELLSYASQTRLWRKGAQGNRSKESNRQAWELLYGRSVQC